MESAARRTSTARRVSTSWSRIGSPSCCNAHPTARKGAAWSIAPDTCRARLCGRSAGHPGTVQLGGGVQQVLRLRCTGWLRYYRVDRFTPVQLRRRRHVRHLVWCTHAGGRRQDEPTSSQNAAAQPRGHSSGWVHKIRNHGAFELGQQLGWAFSQLRGSPDPVVRATFEAEDVADWFEAMPLRKGLSPLSAVPEFEEYVLTQMTHGDDDEPDADVRHWNRIGVNWHHPRMNAGSPRGSKTQPASAVQSRAGLTRRPAARGAIAPWSGPGTQPGHSSYRADSDAGSPAACPRGT